MNRPLAAAAALAFAAGIALTASAAEPPTPPPPPTPQQIAPGVWMIPGGFFPNRQPDGNTLIFEGGKGLVVMDTGRHRWHRQAILDFARSRGRPIVAIVNSHWHLDHVSGNADLKAAYPGAKVYASDAIDGALVGFLKTSAAEGRKYYEKGGLPPETMDDLGNDLATIDHGERLRPDVVVRKSGPVTLAGRKLEVNLAIDAATDGDLWVFDRKSGVLATGDLITLPAPFLDTACPKGWLSALDRLAATPFKTVVPGHGAPMSRTDFDLYRKSFSQFIDCAALEAKKEICAEGWATAVTPLLGGDAKAMQRAKGMAGYYVDMLRANGGKSKSCRTA